MTHKHGGDIYTYREAEDFSANINYRGMPDSVRAAAEAAVAQAVHYPDPDCRALREALAERENRLARKLPERTWENACTLRHILCGNGAAELMFALAAAYRPQKALLAVPSFFEYEQALSAFGCRAVRFRLKPEDDFRLGTEFVRAAEAFLRGGEVRRVLILGNPNNPTGRLIGADVLEQLIMLCERRRALLVLDESFFDFLSEEDRRRTFSGVARIPENPYLFVIRSFTKIYAMPGLRFGYGLCGDAALLSRMRALLQPWNVSVVAQAAAQAAASELTFAAETAAQTAKYRTQLAGALADCGCRVFPSEANFLLFTGPGDLQKQCLRHGILIRDCGNFPGLSRAGDGSGYFRVCVRSPEENERLIRAVRQAMRETAGV